MQCGAEWENWYLSQCHSQSGTIALALDDYFPRLEQAGAKSEAEQAAEGPDRPLLLRWQARGKDPGGPSDNDLGVRHAVGLDELMSARDVRSHATPAYRGRDGPRHEYCAPSW